MANSFASGLIGNVVGGPTIQLPEVSLGFTITILDTEANILARSGDALGTIAFGTDTFSFYVSDGNDNWAIFENS